MTDSLLYSKEHFFSFLIREDATGTFLSHLQPKGYRRFCYDVPKLDPETRAFLKIPARGWTCLALTMAMKRKEKKLKEEKAGKSTGKVYQKSHPLLR